MNGNKKVLLVHPAGVAVLPELAAALRRAGAEVEEHFMTEDYSSLLDKLVDDVLPVVVKR